MFCDNLNDHYASSTRSHSPGATCCIFGRPTAATSRCWAGISRCNTGGRVTAGLLIWCQIRTGNDGFLQDARKIRAHHFRIFLSADAPMNSPYRDRRKIDPTRGDTLGDNTPNDADRIEIGPTQLAYREWEAAGLALPDLQAMRRYRWERLTAHVVARGYGGLLMFDPLNIRYATDSTNMQLWNTHNPFRAVLLCADGYMVIWDYKNAPFLSQFNPLVREVRSGADLFYFDRGDKIDIAADAFSNEVRLLIAEHAGGNTRLAVDKIMVHGLRALPIFFGLIP